jgi:carboxylate-amine ligase
MAASTAARRLLDMVRPHAAALDCLREVEHVETILARGTSADLQVAIYEAAIADGCGDDEALRRVSAWLQQETLGQGPGFGDQRLGIRETVERAAALSL